MRVLGMIAAAEGAAGAVALLAPALVVRALFGAEISSAGAVMTRITGSALIGLAVSCWPQSSLASRAAWRGMLLYSVLAAVCLALAAGKEGLTGPLLWPGVATHVLFVVLLARPTFGVRKIGPAH